MSDTVELLNDKVIFEIVLPTNNYRVEKMPLYSNDEYNLSEAKELGTLGETEMTKMKIGPILNPLDIKEIEEKHNISFSKEKDRLIFTGQFKKGTTVNILLYKNLSSKVYNVPISKRPYTALCIDVFTDEENENGITITKYINEIGIEGEYSIYLEVDGKIYDTNKYVEF